MLTPADFGPYRTEITDCHCALCRYADGTTAADLLEALRTGTHRRVEWSEHIAAARELRAAEIAEACVAGVSERRMSALIRGYATSRDSDFWPYGPAGPMLAREFVVGSGVGASLGVHAAREAEWQKIVDEADRARAATVERLIAADRRNRCTYFRFQGQLCQLHRDVLVPSGASCP